MRAVADRSASSTEIENGGKEGGEVGLHGIVHHLGQIGAQERLQPRDAVLNYVRGALVAHYNC